MFRYQQWIELLKLRHFEKFLLFIIGNYYMFFQKKVQFCANLFNDFLFISKQLLKHFRNNLLFKYNLCPIFGPTYIFVPFRLYHYQKCLSVINNFHWKAKRTILRRTFLYVNGMDFNMCGVIEEIKIHHLLKSGRLQRKIKQPSEGGGPFKIHPPSARIRRVFSTTLASKYLPNVEELWPQWLNLLEAKAIKPSSEIQDH